MPFPSTTGATHVATPADMTDNADSSQIWVSNAHKLHSVIASNNHATDDLYLLFWDQVVSESQTVYATAPSMSVPIRAGNGQGGLDYGSSGRPIKRGIFVALSTSPTAFTLVNPTDYNAYIELTYTKP